MLRFSLTVNSQEQDGFKLSVQAQSKEEMDVAERLTQELINKIVKIEVAVKNYEE
jgi:hypothetical protein